MDACFTNEPGHSETTAPVMPTAAEQKHRDNAQTALILGIIGDVIAWFPMTNIGALILGILALVRSNKNRRFAQENGIQEAGTNIAARWCGIGSIIVSGLFILLYLFLIILFLILAIGVFSTIGTELVSTLPELI